MEINVAGKSCVHEIDPSTRKLKGGFIQGKCIKCGAKISRVYPLTQNPVRIKPKLNKKELKKLSDTLREKN